MIKLRFIIFISLLIVLPITRAQSLGEKDYSVDVLARSFPLAGFVKGKLGYGIPVWGSGIAKGFIHNSISFKSSGTINTIGDTVSFYPISILGLFSGIGLSHRKNNKLPTFDCLKVVCESSKVTRKFYGLRFALAYKSIFYMNENKWTNIKLKKKNEQNFADETVTLIGHKNKDITLETLHLFGINIFDTFSIGLLYKHNQMKNFRNQSNMAILFSKLQFENFTLLLGPGGHRDRLGNHHFTFLANFKWTGNKGLLLF